MTIINNIKNRIKQSKIKPVAKWKFYLMNIIWWLLFILLFLATSIAFGVIVYILKGADWEVAKLIGTGIWGKLILITPKLWLSLILITTILSVWEFRKTKKGYRFDATIILIAVVIGSILIGSLVYASGLGERLDSLLADSVPLYRGRLNQQMYLWDRADKGLLIGHIMDINGNEVILFAPGGVEWIVDVSLISDTSFAKGQVLKIEGEKIADNKFMAKTVFILEMKGFMRNHMSPNHHFMPPDEHLRNFERFYSPPAYK